MADRNRRDARRPGGRLARSYLAVRAEQTAERQPRDPAKVAGVVRLPRLDVTQLNSPEAHAQYRVAVLARLALGGEEWFTLAQPTPPRRRSWLEPAP